MKKRRFLLIALMCCFVFAGSILVACNGEDSDFTVSFDTQGGSNIAEITVGNGQVIGEVAPPAKQCARFIGFALDAGGERMWNLQTDTVSADITLYAIWEDAHTWGDWADTTPATCTEDGERTRECEVCGKTESEAINALGHDYEEEYTEDIAPTCENPGSESRHCIRCDATTDSREINALGHTWGEWATLTEPTCIDEGLRRHICEVCGKDETKSIPALGHDFEEEYTVDVAPDCVTKGSESRHCTRCDATTDSREIEATGQTWGEGAPVTEPTCTAEGTHKHICEVCGEEDTDSIPSLGHDFEEEYTVDVAPDCETKGSESRHCARCDATTDSREIEATGHTWGEWETLTEPTCTAEGTHKHICEVCGEEDTDSIPALGHDFEEEYTVDVAPDCVTKGSESRHCTRCDATTDSREIEATGHTWGEWETVTEPTCTTEGTHKRICEVCGEEESDNIPSLGHDFTKWEYDDTEHWKICSRCGSISEKTAHVYDEFEQCECGTIKVTPESEFTFTALGDGKYSLAGYSGARENIKIPATYNGGTVVSIESSAFADCNGITSVIIPDSVTSIGKGAFSGCSSLESITIPFVGAEADKTSSDTYQYPFGYIFGTSRYTGHIRYF